MSKADDFPENLSVRGRRGTLSPGEQAQLDHLLQVSATLRATHRAGQDFDRIGAVQARDEQRVARFVTAALHSRRRQWYRVARLRSVSPWLLAAAVLGFGGVAFGLRGTWWPIRDRHLADQAALHAPSVSARGAPAQPSKAPESAPLESVATTQGLPPTLVTSLAYPSSSSDRSAPIPGVAIARSSVSGVPSPTISSSTLGTDRAASTAAFAVEQPAQLTAASLLRQVNSARGRGLVDQAVSLFMEIQQKFPGSPEATLSLVSLGKLLMQRGAAGAALQQFSSYLASGGPLEEEALVGQAQALSALGRQSEERQTWETLMARFPASVYVARARDRLRILDNHASR